MNRVLLVEDEDSLAIGLVDVLELKGYRVTRESRGGEALQRALEETFDLILLDAELPGLSGFEILKTLRSQNRNVPVIMLTARQTEMDRVLGFELGTDDYVTKPFSLLELLGRIGAVLRRTGASESSPEVDGTVRLGLAELDLRKFSAQRDGSELTLPTKAYDVLRILLDRKGQVITRDDLIDEAWGSDEGVTLRTLNNVIVKIRAAIEPDPEEPRHLRTVHGVGYRLEM